MTFETEETQSKVQTVITVLQYAAFGLKLAMTTQSVIA